LVHPDSVLTKIRDYLKKDGCVLASIPNLMNAEVIYNLLKGRFTYEEAGIRDMTHLRFFTYQEIMKMFVMAGYNTEQALCIVCPGCTTDDYGDFFKQLLAIDGVAPKEQFDTYQYLVRARRAL
jgi:hypothetical protein